MSECDSCTFNDNCKKEKNGCMIENNPLNKVKKIIGVMSGKGGVGKSSISVLIAKELRKLGYSVGILDADITGPSIPKLLKLDGAKAGYNGELMLPAVSSDGIKVMSLNLLVDNEEEPVIWRGPIISGTVKQFWTNVLWGELDYLIIDMPPGTGDVALTVMQSIPINGLVMVSVPQNLVSMIVAKAVNMAKKMNIKIIGVIENMSYVVCGHCGEKIRLFDSQDAQKFLNETNMKLLGELPVLKSISKLSSDEDDYQKMQEIFSPIVQKIIESIR